MALFQFPTNKVLTSYSKSEDAERTRSAPRGTGTPQVLDLNAEDGKLPEVADQFIVCHFSREATGPTILEASRVDPALPGSESEPDVLVGLEMLTFHLGRLEAIDQDTCATLRINFGKDENSENRILDTVFWSVAAGLKLYDAGKGGKPEGKAYKSDFRRAFANRPIEIPGGLGRLSFEVVKHQEPAWWRKLLGFGTSQAARQLVSVLGFPAITVQAISVIDELLDRLDDARPEVMFRSVPMRLALTKWASDKFTLGNPRIKMGSLCPGLCVLARGRDFEAIADSNAVYYPHLDRLAPDSVPESKVASGQYDDPLADVTYAIFKVGMKATKIDPAFNF